jgi:hypothetical protein
MHNPVLLNVLLNMTFSIIFVMLNGWALQNQLEETFVSLALFYGCIVTIGNALFTYFRKAA